MKTKLLAISAIAASAVIARADIERVTEKTFPATPDQLLQIDSQSGNIHVVPGVDNQVHVVAHTFFRAKTEQQADDLAHGLTLDIAQTPDGVSARSSFDPDSTVTAGRWENRGSSLVRVVFDVTVPTRTRTNLETRGGNITVGDLAGKIAAHTGGGNVSLGKIGADVDVYTGGGNVTVGQCVGHLVADTHGGQITIDRLQGDGDVKTSGGNIHLGSIAGAVHARTSGGNIFAAFDGTPRSDCELRTSGGNVKMAVPSDAAFRLDASSSGGNVEVATLDLKIEHGGNGKNSLVGEVHGGGPLVTLRTSGGHVDVAVAGQTGAAAASSTASGAVRPLSS